MIKSIYKKVLVYLCLFVFVLSGSVYANEQLNLPDTKINPGSFYYPVKRLWEKGQEKLQFGRQAKINLYGSLLKTRLAELNYVVEKKLLSQVQGSSERFAYYAGILTEEIVKQNKDADKKNLIKEFENFSPFLESLRDKYEANSSFWMLVQHDINTLRILSDQLK